MLKLVNIWENEIRAHKLNMNVKTSKSNDGKCKTGEAEQLEYKM